MSPCPHSFGKASCRAWPVALPAGWPRPDDIRGVDHQHRNSIAPSLIAAYLMTSVGASPNAGRAEYSSAQCYGAASPGCRTECCAGCPASLRSFEVSLPRFRSAFAGLGQMIKRASDLSLSFVPIRHRSFPVERIGSRCGPAGHDVASGLAANRGAGPSVQNCKTTCRRIVHTRSAPESTARIVRSVGVDFGRSICLWSTRV